MGRQPRPLPATVERFNYWDYEFSHPEATKDSTIPSADRIAHAKILKTFQEIRGNPVIAAQYQHHFQRDLQRMRILPTPDILALVYYLDTDRLWTQDAEAGKLLSQQPQAIQDALRTWARDVWRRRVPWSWDALLQRIASDQALFQEILSLGPTRAGLVGTQRPGVSLIWKRFAISEADAQRVYRAYHRKMSELSGRGVIVSQRVRAALCARGMEVPRKRETRTMPALVGLPSANPTSIILHWFAHALRNLARYRQGHAPLPWHPTVCEIPCLKVQQALTA